MQFSYRRKCIGYKSVQHYNIRRAIQKKRKKKQITQTVIEIKVLVVGTGVGVEHGGVGKGRREVAGQGEMTSHTLIDFHVVGVGSFFILRL